MYISSALIACHAHSHSSLLLALIQNLVVISLCFSVIFGLPTYETGLFLEKLYN